MSTFVVQQQNNNIKKLLCTSTPTWYLPDPRSQYRDQIKD